MKPIKIFKFQTRERLELLLNDGMLYLNTREYYRDLAFNNVKARISGIGDRYEQTIEIENVGKSFIKATYVDGSKKIEHFENLQIITYDLTSSGHIFCMTALSESSNLKEISKKMINTYKYCLVIHDVESFLHRVQLMFNLKEINYEIDFVKYNPLTENKIEMNPFIKPESLLYQSEFRIVTKTKGNQPLIVKIGSLNDIAEIIPSKNIINHLP